MRCVWDWVLDRGDVIECGVMYGIECGRGEEEERDLEGSMGCDWREERGCVC